MNCLFHKGTGRSERRETQEAVRAAVVISNNRRKMKGMPLTRAKAIEKARKNARRKPKK